MGRPRRSETLVATTERLLSAAEKHFGQHGFDAARLQDIAKDAGITRPSLLYHFETKEKLYDAVVARAFDQFLAAMQNIQVTGTDFRDVIEAFTNSWISFLGEFPHVGAIILKEFTSPSTQGEHIIKTKFVPAVDFVEQTFSTAGKEHLRSGIPVRAALMQIAVDALVRSSMGELGDALWGPENHSGLLSRMLFLNESS